MKLLWGHDPRTYTADEAQQFSRGLPAITEQMPDECGITGFDDGITSYEFSPPIQSFKGLDMGEAIKARIASGVGVTVNKRQR